jgi:hypothetical protein
MQKEFHASLMTVTVKMVNATSVEARRTTNNTMDLQNKVGLAYERQLADGSIESQILLTVYPFASKNSAR